MHLVYIYIYIYHGSICDTGFHALNPASQILPFVWLNRIDTLFLLILSGRINRENVKGLLECRCCYSGWWDCYLFSTIYFGHHKWIAKLFFNNTTTKVFICSFEYGLLLVLQDSWSLGLLVLETKWLSGVLIKQRVLSDVWGIVFRVTVYFLCVWYFGGEYALSPLIWTRSEIWASVSRAELRSVDIAIFFGWHEVVPVEGMLNVSNLCSTGIPRKESIN